jgi:hypothetical protein
LGLLESFADIEVHLAGKAFFAEFEINVGSDGEAGLEAASIMLPVFRTTD